MDLFSKDFVDFSEDLRSQRPKSKDSFSTLINLYTVPAPLLGAASIQKKIFWPSDYNIKSI